MVLEFISRIFLKQVFDLHFKKFRSLEFSVDKKNFAQLGYKVYHLKRKRKYGTPLLKENNNIQKKNKNDKNK